MSTEKTNLSTMNIAEFDSSNTIYIRDKSEFNKPTYLCEFVSFDAGKRNVTGKIITKDGRDSSRAGNILTNKISQCALYGSATETAGHEYYHWFQVDGYSMNPMEEYKIIENEMHCKSHPSYGLARFSRHNSSGGRPLFGSSINHSNTISLHICRSDHDRGLSNDWYHAKQELIEIEMSQTQFAELITSMNMGSGIPVTIRHINLEQISEPPYKSKVEIFNDEFKAKMHNMGVDIEKASATALDLLKNKSTLNNGDRELILSSITRLMMNVKQNIPFVAVQFSEQMDKTISEAKGEIEAFVEHKIRSAGLEAIGASGNFPTINELTESLSKNKNT